MSEIKTSKYKQISFNELTKISNSNFGKYNRNVDVEKVIKKLPQFRNWNMVCTTVMIHEHYMGEEIEPHYRCYIINDRDSLPSLSEDEKSLVGELWIQDMSFEQYESLKDLTTEQQRIIKV